MPTVVIVPVVVPFVMPMPVALGMVVPLRGVVLHVLHRMVRNVRDGWPQHGLAGRRCHADGCNHDGGRWVYRDGCSVHGDRWGCPVGPGCANVCAEQGE